MWHYSRSNHSWGDRVSQVPDPRRWIALILLCATQFMLIIDVSIVNVALPTIERDLHFTDSSLQWVASAYALTFGGFLLLGGRMADLLGRRKMFMVGLAVFSIASLACGFANTNNLLIAARAVQGLGAALIAPAALSILTTTFAEGEERNKALGVWGAVSGAGGAAGVLLGGVLTEWAGWEWVFFVNVPIGVIAILLAPRLLDESRVEDAERSFDVIGAVTVTASLSLLVYTVVKTDEYHWISGRTIGLFIVSLLLMAVFLINEQRASHPLLPLSFFRLPTIVGANVVGFMLGAAIFSMFFLLALYMQSAAGLHYTALRSGLGYLLIACTIIVSAGASQAFVGRLGVLRVLAAGLVLLTLGLLFFSRVSPHGTYLGDLAPGFILGGIGLGFAFIPVTIAALMGVTNDEAGLASGLINTSQQIGGAVGVALLATVFTSRTSEQIAHGVAPDVAFTDGLSRAFLVGAVMTLLGLVAAVALIREPKGTPEAAAVAEVPVA
jgi:EmrB/QacA subfamily drug resistance transporter